MRKQKQKFSAADLEVRPIATPRANDRQVGGNHYRKTESPLEHWDMVALFSLDYFQGNITKYVMRWRDKGGTQDLEKARHYLDKYIEIEKARTEGAQEAVVHSLIKQAMESLEDTEEES